MECKCNQPNYRECNGHLICVNCGMFKPQAKDKFEELLEVTAKVHNTEPKKVLARAMELYCKHYAMLVLCVQFGKLLDQPKPEIQPKQQPKSDKQPLEYARELRDSGMSCNRISNIFNNEGLKQPNGNEWYPIAIVRLLSKTTPVQTAKQLAMQLREQGMSYSNIAINLNKKGFARPNGTKWYAMVVSELIK